MKLTVAPTTLRAANAFVRNHHRHHKEVPGMKFAIAVKDGDTVVGVAICGRPVARKLDNGLTIEVNRCCTDGTKNACSMLYGAAWRIAREMGYQRIITYTLPDEGGVSLRASGWTHLGEAGGGNWNVPSRPRKDTPEKLAVIKWIWERKAA